MSYFTVKEEANSRFEEKKSIFIGSIRSVCTENGAKKFISKIKLENSKASHNVYAYVIGEKMNIQRYSDDGEPQGTAGIPILEVIKQKGITDVVIVVTRHFGGTLLGKGGLIKAYSKSATLAIHEAKIVEKVQGSPIDILIEYDNLGKLQYMFEQKSIYVENIEYADKVKLSINCIIESIDKLINEIIEATNGKCEVIVGDEESYFKIDNRLIKE
ncbi:YigZ family protein [Clostridium sp. WILCCON 0269]|uniref:YigZ family protein n=1 Tax=Candidatus Clostridium eludens TaxID=3381663 RepID=A0ABW8SF10_9CLOT